MLKQEDPTVEKAFPYTTRPLTALASTDFGAECAWFHAAITAGLAAHFWGALRRQTAFWPKALLSILALSSLAALTFLVYNILAGGNPPKQDKAVTASESMTPQKAY